MAANLLTQPRGDDTSECGDFVIFDSSRTSEGNLKRFRDRPRTACEHLNPIGKTDGFAHVVGDEDARKPSVDPESFEFVVKQIARHRIERTERLVHQQDFRFLCESARNPYPLTHPTRELMGLVSGEVLKVHGFQKILSDSGPFASRNPAQLQRKRNVLRDRHPRKQGRFLKDQRAPTIESDIAKRRLFKSSDEIQECRLTASACPDERNKCSTRCIE
jgi:hypothetical protein